ILVPNDSQRQYTEHEAQTADFINSTSFASSSTLKMNLEYPLTSTNSYDPTTSIYSSTFDPHLCVTAFSKTMTDSNSSGTSWQSQLLSSSPPEYSSQICSASPINKTPVETFTDFNSVQFSESNIRKDNYQQPVVAFKTKNFLTVNPGNVE
ncbi:14722_t:CDS:2, partial [Racocetra persica]